MEPLKLLRALRQIKQVRCWIGSAESDRPCPPGAALHLVLDLLPQQRQVLIRHLEVILVFVRIDRQRGHVEQGLSIVPFSSSTPDTITRSLGMQREQNSRLLQ